MAQMCKFITWAFDCTVDFEFSRNYPATVNSPRETGVVLQVMRSLVGDQMVDAAIEPTMGAEDFAFMLQEVPGCYGLIGNGEGDHRHAGHGLGPCSLHNSSYDFNDNIIDTGMRYWLGIVDAELGNAGK
jgi:hippurate hydrolase